MCLISSQYILSVVFNEMMLMNVVISLAKFKIFLTDLGIFVFFKDFGIVSCY